MTTPIHDNLILPDSRVLVLVDALSETTGTIFRKSFWGGGQFATRVGVSDHVLFVKEAASPVEIDGQEYLAMHTEAIVGVIPT